MPYFFLLAIVFLPTDVFAGAVAMQEQRVKAMQEQAMAQYQQALAEKQAAEVRAYQEAVAQYQAAQIEAARREIIKQQAQAIIQAQINQYVQQVRIQRAQQLQLKQAAEEELAKQLAVRIQQGVAQQVQERMAAQAVAVAAQQLQLKAYESALVDKAALEQVLALRQQQATQVAAAAVVPNVRPYEPGDQNVQDIVDIAFIWQKLETNSKAWALMIDNQAKAVTVNEFIERFRREGIRIQKPPLFYANMIDDMAMQSPQMLLQPFKEILQLLAVMEYDFENGRDPDQLAQQMLGGMYEANKKRLGK